MGNFTMVIKGVGGHGCDRGAKEGDKVEFVHSEEHATFCPDCAFKSFVEAHRAWFGYGNHSEATLRHWPGESSEIVDDVLNMKRIKGGF